MNIDFLFLDKATANTGGTSIVMVFIIGFILWGVYALEKRPKPNTDINNLNINKLVTKIICMIGGIVGAAIGAYTIYSDKEELFGYNYEAPLSDHEIGVIILIVASVIVFVVGAIISSYND